MSIKEDIIKILEKNGYKLNQDYYLGPELNDNFKEPSWVHKETDEWISSDSLLEKTLKCLIDYNITENIKPGLGFNPETKTWYGWNYNGIREFKIGDIIDKGHPCYIPSNKEEFIERLNNYDMANINIIKIIPDVQFDKIEGVEITYITGEESTTAYSDFEPYPEKWEGKREIKTLDDAKEMAIRYSKTYFVD